MAMHRNLDIIFSIVISTFLVSWLKGLLGSEMFFRSSENSRHKKTERLNKTSYSTLEIPVFMLLLELSSWHNHNPIHAAKTDCKFILEY